MRTPPFFRNTALLCASLLIILMSACDKDEDSISIDEFVGSWKATSAIHTNNSNPAETFDIVSNGGEVRFTMLAGGKVRTWVQIGTFTDEWDAEATLSGSTITSVPVESSRPTNKFTFDYDGTTLILTNVDDRFNFTNGVGPNVATTSVNVFQRH